MANENIDIIRVEDTEVNLPTTVIPGQLGFSTDSNKMLHLMLDGITEQWFASESSTWLYWDSNGNGGITTTTPQAKLEIYATRPEKLALSDPLDSVGNHLLTTYYAATNEKFSFGFYNSATPYWGVIPYNEDTAFAILTDGKVGINTNVPSVDFEVNGASLLGGNVEINGNIMHTSDNQHHYWGADDDVSRTFNGTDLIDDFDILGAETIDYRIQEYGSDRLVIYTGGNILIPGKVGINTIVANEYLEIDGNIRHMTDNNYHYWGASNDVGRTFNGTDLIDDFDLLNSGTTDYRLQQNGTDIFSVLASGKVGINVPTPWALLQCYALNSQGLITIQDDRDTNGTPAILFHQSRLGGPALNGDTCGTFLFQANNNASTRFNFAWLNAYVVDNSAGAEDGKFSFSVANNTLSKVVVEYDETQMVTYFGDCGFNSDNNFAYNGASNDVGRTFNGTDLIDDFDILGAETIDYRIQEYGSDRLVIYTGGNILIPGKVGINTIVANEYLEIDGNIRHMTDNNYHYWGASNDVGRTFNGTDLIDNYDVQNAGTVDYRIQENGVDRLTVFAGGNVEVNGNIMHTSDSQSHYWGDSNDVGRTFNGTDLIDDFDILGAETIDYRIQENGVNRFVIYANGGIVEIGSTIRAATSNYRRYYHFSVAGFSPGASGATWIPSDTNVLCGWQLNTSAEKIEDGGLDVHSDWDGASDIVIELPFTVNIDNSGGNVGDTVDIKIDVFFKGIGDTFTKLQTLEVATIVGQAAQYTMFVAEFIINYDEPGGKDVNIGDRFCLTINLETDTSEVDDIIIHGGSFHYNTSHVGIEANDV